jgi:hypothetical protein
MSSGSRRDGRGCGSGTPPLPNFAGNDAIFGDAGDTSSRSGDAVGGSHHQREQRAAPEQLSHRYLVFQRAKQLQNGARPRVDAVGHKPTRVALMEVAADAISWTVG